VAADALRALVADFAATPATDEHSARAVLSRMDDLIEAIESADKALARIPHPSMADAAAKTAHLFYASGRGWRRYLGESPYADRGEDVRRAIITDSAAVIEQLARMLAAREKSRVTQRGGGGYGLPCSACGADAVSVSLTTVGNASPPQLVVSSLSPVTVFRPITGPRMQDIVKLLDAGIVDTVVKHLRETQPGGCDAHCDECNRLYCKSHYAVEAQWSGSWHEATYATCPLGHEHEID
jgi:hypothetical protein